MNNLKHNTQHKNPNTLRQEADMGSTSVDSPLTRSQTTKKQFPGSFVTSEASGLRLTGWPQWPRYSHQCPTRTTGSDSWTAVRDDNHTAGHTRHQAAIGVRLGTCLGVLRSACPELDSNPRVCGSLLTLAPLPQVGGVPGFYPRADEACLLPPAFNHLLYMLWSGKGICGETPPAQIWLHGWTSHSCHICCRVLCSQSRLRPRHV